MVRYPEVFDKYGNVMPREIQDIRSDKSRKDGRFCAMCGAEIKKNEYYYSYKPFGKKRMNRCIDHPPKYYDEYNTHYENTK